MPACVVRWPMADPQEHITMEVGLCAVNRLEGLTDVFSGSLTVHGASWLAGCVTRSCRLTALVLP